MDTKDNRQTTHSAVMVRLDEEANNRLLQAHKRSGRSKANEATLRLKDHLERFPDFYNSESVDILPKKS